MFFLSDQGKCNQHRGILMEYHQPIGVVHSLKLKGQSEVCLPFIKILSGISKFIEE